MRIRTVKPQIWHDERVRGVSRDARLLFVALITLADDDGRFHALPAVIRGHAYPLDHDAERKIPKWLSELSDAGLIGLYEEHYGHLPNWTRHQKISHRTPSCLPNPSGNGHEPFRNDSGGSPE